MLREKLDKLIAKKKQKGEELSENEQKAKMCVADDIRKFASDALGDRVKNLKKVSVMSDSEEGLEKGLEKAKEIVESDELPDQEEMESEESDKQEESSDGLSEDELDAKIAELMALKEKIKK